MSENINEELQQVKTKGNRKYLTFLATEDMVKLKIPNTCPTRLQMKVSRIQLEKGKYPSEYEAPKQERVGASGIFKRLGALEINMSDENSDLWSRIKANNRAMIVGYFREDVENKLAINSKQVINQIESKIDDRLTILRSSIDGIERRVRGLNGVKSDITQLSDLIASKVSREDVQSLILQDEENIIQRVKSNLDGRELITSINLDKSGVRIKGELITLDGNAYITNGIIENSHIKNATITSSKIRSISASKINTGTLDALKVNVINLNADNLSTGSISSGIFRTSFNNVNNIVTIDGSGLTVDGNWGGKIFFNNRGLTFFDKLANLEMGSIYGLYRIESDPLRRTKMGSLGVFATYGYGLALGMRNVREDSFYTFQYMTMDGPTHVIRTYANAEFHYNMKFYGGNITGLKSLQMTGRLTGATNAGYEYNYGENGAYIRFNNGLKICWHKMGYKARSQGWEAWKFPITFDNPPTVTANLFKGQMVKGVTAYPSAISTYAANITVSDTNLEYNINVMAIGF